MQKNTNNAINANNEPLPTDHCPPTTTSLLQGALPWLARISTTCMLENGENVLQAKLGPMGERRIEPLNDAEKTWVADELANARRLVAQYSPSDANAPLTPKVLDRAFKAAYHQNPKDEEHANATINTIGIAFGQYLVDQLGLQWVAVFDDQGSELAVVGLPGKADMLVFPPNLVAKRWTAGTTNFLWYLFKGIKEDFAMFQEHLEEHDQPLPSTSHTRRGLFSWFRRLFSPKARR